VSGAGEIRVGIGGWDYEPWRETFYPPKLPKTKRLEYASRQVTAIEINATYYKLQKPELFARWRDATPEGFRFSIKGSRYCSNRKVLAEAGEAVTRFCGQGFVELGDKLGPILWQFMATKRFDPDDFRAFLALLPREAAGVPLRHAVEPRHESFRDPAFVAMAREAGVAIVHAESDDYPCIDALSGGFAYARLQRSRSGEPAAYPPAEIDAWAAKARAWAAEAGDVYMFMIAGAKERAPAAAMALIERL
jgi:uncharacterized protein YecE (DUF72 family)